MRGLAPRITMCPVRFSHPLVSRISINRLMIGAPDSRYPTMSVLNTQRLLPDSKLESDEEQGPPN
jgi:hypothetical protein